MSDVSNLDDVADAEARDFISRYRARGGRRPAPPVDDLPALRRRLAELDAATPTGARAQARAQRDAALRRIDADETAALAGVVDPAVQRATRSAFTEQREAVNRTYSVAEAEARRREDVAATSRAGLSRILVHGPDVRGGGPGLLDREVRRRIGEINDRMEIDLASARAAEIEAGRSGRSVNLQQGVRDRAATARAEIERWARESGEAWATQQVDAGRRERVEARDAQIAREIADERIEILGKIAAAEQAQAQDGNGSA